MGWDRLRLHYDRGIGAVTCADHCRCPEVMLHHFFANSGVKVQITSEFDAAEPTIDDLRIPWIARHSARRRDGGNGIDVAVERE